MQSLMSNIEHHNKAYNVITENIGKQDRDREWAETVFPTAVVAKLAGDDVEYADRPTFRSLGVGSGTGEFELLLLQQLSARFPRMNHTVLEPSHEFITQYQTAVTTSSTAGMMTGINFEWHEETLQEYRERSYDANEQKTFDFISAVHSLYYAGDAIETVRFLYRSLAPGGIIMIAMSDDKSSGLKMFEHIPELRAMFLRDQWISCSDIQSALSELNMEFSRFIYTIPVDITEIYEETSQEGNLLLDFLTHVLNFRDTAGPDLLKTVLSFFRALADDCTSDKGKNQEGKEDERKKDDRIVIHKYWEIFLSTKPRNL